MSDVNANIGVHIDTSNALAQLKNLQREIATFHSSIARTSAAAVQAQRNLQTNLLNSVNATGKFAAQMGIIRTSSESFTHALEKNQLSMREYFRYAGASTQTFGKLFKSEFDTLGKVAEERVKKLQTQYIKMGRDANGAMRAMAITPTSLNMNNLTTQTMVAAQKQAIFNQLLKQGSTNLLNFGKNTQWAGRQLMVGFSVPLMYLGTAAAKVFMNLEAQAVKFKRVYGDMFTTTADTNKALADVQQIAQEFTKYGVAVGDVVSTASDIAAMGKTGTDLTNALTQAVKLSVLGQIDQQQALQTTISLQNAFGISSQDLGKKIDFLNAVENQTVLSIQDLTVAIPKVAPVIKQLGGTVEDAAFFMTAMKEGGIEAAQGANAIKSAMASVINPTKAASNFLAGFNVNIKGIVEANKGNLRSTIVGVARALDTLDPLNRSRAIEMLFGKFQFARISTLFQNITKDGSQANKVLNLTQASVEELAILSQREMKTVQDAVGVKFKASMEQLKVSIAPIGKAFLQAVTPILNAVVGLFKHFNNLSDGTKKFIVTVTALGGILGPLALMTFGLLANGAANLIKLFLIMRTGIGKLGGESKNLGEQLTYFNDQQLEGVTVAASLNQAHTQLTQKFELEATAVAALRNAYTQAAVAAKEFALANPGMMSPRVRGKFATGTTGLPGPSGAGDIIPIMAAPGEAIIPAKAAQDPANRPFISSLVKTGKIQGFEYGTVNVGGKSYTTTSQSTALNLENKIAELLASGFTEERIARALDTNMAKGRPISASGLVRRLSIGRGAGAGTSQSNSGEIKKIVDFLKGEFTPEIAHVTKALADKGYVLADTQVKNLFNLQKSHITKDVLNGKKQWNNANVVGDLGYVNNYLNTVERGLGVELLAKSDIELAALGIDREELLKLKNGNHPTNAKAAETLRGVAKYDLSKGRSYAADAVLSGLEYRSANNFYSKPMRTFDVLIKDLHDSAIEKVKKQANVKRARKINENGKLVAVSEGEVIRTSDGSIELITKENAIPKPKGLKTNSPKDNLATVLGSNEHVFKLPGHADAPYLNPYAGMDPQFAAEQKSLRRQSEKLQAEQQRALKQNITAVEANTIAAEEATAAEKKMGMKFSTGVNVASSSIFLLSFMNNKVGDFAQKLVPLAIAVPMLTSVIKSTTLKMAATNFQRMLADPIKGPIASFAIALTAAVVATHLLTKTVNDARDKVFKQAEASGNTAENITALSKYAGTVSAGDILAYRRDQARKPFSVQAGKETYGEQFIRSDAGKTLVSGLKNMYGSQGSDATRSNLQNYLSTAVLSGTVTKEQARSMALNLGQELGNTSLGIQVSAKLDELLGPTGDDVLKNGLDVNVRAKMIDTAIKNVSSAGNLAGNAGGFKVSNMGLGSMNRTQAILGAGAAGAGATIAGAAALGTSVGPIGTAIGAVIGIGIAFASIRGQAKAIAEATASMVVSQKEALNIANQMTSSLQVNYEKAIANAKAAGDEATAKKLTLEYESKRQLLATKRQALDKQIMTNIDSMRGQTAAAYNDATRTAVTNKFKGTADEAFAAQALTATKGAKVILSKGQKEGRAEMRLNLAMSSGELTPAQVIGIMQTFGKDKRQLTTFMTVMTKFGGAEAGKAADVVQAFVSKDGKINKEAQSAFLLQVSTQKTDKAADDLISFYQKIGQNQGILDVGLMVNYFTSKDGEKQKNDLDKIFKAIDQNDGKLEIDVITKFLPPEVMGAINQDYFKSLDQNQRKTYVQEVSTIMEITDETIIKKDPEYIKWTKDNGAHGGAKLVAAGASFPTLHAAYAESMGEKVTAANTSVSVTPSSSSSSNNGAGTKPTASSLDSLVQKLRDVYQQNIKLTTGWDASSAALNRLFKVGIHGFAGLSNAIRTLKVPGNQNMIDFILGMSPEEWEAKKKKIFNFDKKGNILSMTTLGKNIQAGLNLSIVGAATEQNRAEIQATKDKETALKRLAAAGITTEQALKLVEDKALTAAIASMDIKKGSKAWQDFIKSVKEAGKALAQTTDDMYNTFNTEYSKAQDYFSASAAFIQSQRQAGADALQGDINNAQNAVDAAQAQVDAANAKIQAQQNLIDANNHQIDLLQRSIEINFTRPIAEYQKQIDALNEQIANQYDKPIAALQQQNDLLSHNLSLIEHQAQAVNEQYDAQQKALDAINKANQDAINLGKQKMTIADAITRGDVSAAAAAVQDLRATQAQQNAQSQSDALANARQAALDNLTAGGMTRKQIEQQQWTISEQIYGLEQQKKVLTDQIAMIQETKILPLQKAQAAVETQIVALQDQNYGYEQAIYNIKVNQLDPAQQALDKANKQLDTATKALDTYNKQTQNLIDQEKYLGLTKKQWDDNKVAVDKAYQSIKASEASITASQTAAEGILAAYKALNGQVSTVTIITNHIDTYSGSAPVYGPGNPNLQTGPAGALGAGGDQGNQNPAATTTPSAAALAAGVPSTATGSYAGYWNAKMAAMSSGGIVPQYLASGGIGWKAVGTDTVPAMLTPGEFVVNAKSAQKFEPMLKKMNEGTFGGLSDLRVTNTNMQSINNSKLDSTNNNLVMYNYKLDVNVAGTNSDANDIANVVMRKIKEVDDQRIRRTIV